MEGKQDGLGEFAEMRITQLTVESASICAAVPVYPICAAAPSPRRQRTVPHHRSPTRPRTGGCEQVGKITESLRVKPLPGPFF